MIEVALTRLLRVVNFVFLQSIHNVASLSGIHTAACSVNGCFPAEENIQTFVEFL
jgi:hypothetical protein